MSVYYKIRYVFITYDKSHLSNCKSVFKFHLVSVVIMTPYIYETLSTAP